MVDHSRRNILNAVSGLGALGALATPMAMGETLSKLAQTKRQSWSRKSKGLRACKDENTGLELLELPEGFRYFTFAWAGESMHGTETIPNRADGMGMIQQHGDVVTLMRNHEVVAANGAFSKHGANYDGEGSGGVVRIDVNVKTQKAETTAKLTGTVYNCAGGVTPWGSWLTCEEFVQMSGHGSVVSFSTQPGELKGLKKDHGYVFEVFPDERTTAKPLRGMGVFRHEAAVVHAPSGAVFLTEDQRPNSGFYRFTPSIKNDLSSQGVLEMMRVEGRTQCLTKVPLGQWMKTSWVKIDDPERGHSPGTFDGIGVLNQGLAKGGTAFSRLEGCVAVGNQIFFTSTGGGNAELGQLYVFDVNRGAIKLLVESRDPNFMDMPDNINVTPRGGLVIAEDGNRLGKYLLGYHPNHGVLPIAKNKVILGGEKGHQGDFRGAEWAGVCFSKDGRWLFANVYAPGFSVAITGPWETLGL